MYNNFNLYYSDEEPVLIVGARNWHKLSLSPRNKGRVVYILFANSIPNRMDTRPRLGLRPH